MEGRSALVTALRAADVTSEADFQATVIEMARAFGWSIHAERPAFSKGKYSTPIQGDPGWVDLFLVRGEKAMALELKSRRGRLSPEQAGWITDLTGVPGITALVLRPSDMPMIRELLA